MIATLTGLLTGVVHALAGPDHLAAIAPLAMVRIGSFSLRPYRNLLSGSSTVAICMGCVWLLD